MNSAFQNALAGKPQKCPPIWFMRQAGRYHSHYQGIRKDHSFDEMCKNPELAAEVALGPIRDFDFDVSILFSDLLFPLEAFGMGLTYTDQGPRLGFQLDAQNLQTLKPYQEAIPFMQFQADALRATRSLLPASKSLIGFVGGPWTLFVYAVEGSHAGSLTKSKALLSLFPKFCELMVPFLKQNIQLQLDAGAEVVMIFDTAAGELSPLVFQSLVAPYLLELCRAFPEKIGYYSKATQACYFQNEFLQAPWAGRGVDHHWHLPDVLKSRQELVKSSKGQITGHITGQTPGFIQGNFDQSLLFLPTEEFKKVFADFMQPLQNMSPEDRKGWVCGLGHGVLPKTPEKHVRLFVDSVREIFS